ncbi:hypothetical protein ACEWPJ_11260 [Aliiroseovarius sp. YM-037]
MSVTTSFEEKLVTECGTLSTRLKAAAGYFSARPAGCGGINIPKTGLQESTRRTVKRVTSLTDS